MAVAACVGRKHWQASRSREENQNNSLSHRCLNWLHFHPSVYRQLLLSSCHNHRCISITRAMILKRRLEITKAPSVGSFRKHRWHHLLKERRLSLLRSVIDVFLSPGLIKVSVKSGPRGFGLTASSWLASFLVSAQKEAN